LNCCGAASGTWGAKLAEDFKKALNNESVKIKSRNNIDSKYQEKTILNKELSQDNKAPTDTKPQQQSSTLEVSRKPHLSEWHPVTDTLRGGCSERMVFRSVAICCWVLPSMVASSPIPLTATQSIRYRMPFR
jgi:hypothetical protein